MLGKLAQEDDHKASTFARVVHEILENAPDKAEHCDGLVAAALSAEDHQSYIVRRLGCDILAHCLPVCDDVRKTLQIGKHLLSCLQVSSSVA